MTSAPRLLSTASVLVLLLAVAGCYPGGPEALDEIGTVVTQRNPEGRHDGLGTYAMEDTVALLSLDTSSAAPLDPRFDPAILDEIQVQMENAGFRRVDPAVERPDAWVAVGAVQSEVWVYWQTWNYWGGYWGGGWGPSYGSSVSAASFMQGSVVWQLFDLRGLPDPIPPDPEPVVNWIAGINGAIQGSATTEAGIREGIRQAFRQSPYIEATAASPGR
jgi:hypothetical protein